jgi:hypothetical protein
MFSNISVLSERSSEQALLRFEVQGRDSDVGLRAGHVLRAQLHANPSRAKRKTGAAAKISAKRRRSQF